MVSVNLPTGSGAMAAQSIPHADLQHTFVLIGLSPAFQEYRLFRRAYHYVRHAAEYYSPGRHAMQAIYDPDEHERIGYRFWVPSALIALRITICFKLACEGRPMPWMS